MGEFAFKWSGDGTLVNALMQPVERVSMIYNAAWGPEIVTLWRADGSGLRVHSEMHDVAFREEVGVLAFTLVDSLWDEEQTIDVPPFEVSSVYKLTTIEPNGEEAESGIELRLPNGKSVVIVASSGPLYLALDGLIDMPRIFEPEYPIEEYRRSLLS